MKIDLCMIVKDNSEVKMLSNCLDTIQPFVDRIYITATGKEVDKIEKLCKDRDLNYSYFKWCDDFSAARNFNFSRSVGADWIFWLDADDLVVGGEYLRKIAKVALEKDQKVVLFNYWYACSFNGEPSLENFVEVEIDHPRERLFRPGLVKWVGRLHETPATEKGSKENITMVKYSQEFPIAVMHTASMEDAKNKMERNRIILEKQLEDEGKKRDPRTLLNLIKIYAELDTKEHWEKGLEYCKEYLEKSGWDEERGICREYQGQIYQQLDKNDKAILSFHEAIREFPHKPLFYLRLANAYYIAKNYRNAEKWLNIALQMDLSDQTSTPTNLKGMKVLTAELMFKLTWYVKKDVNLAVKAAKLLYEENPTEEAKANYEFLLDVYDLNTACKNLDDYCKYLIDIGEEALIPKIIFNSPQSVQSQPFAISLLKKTVKPRTWGKDEICYFANFGGPHFFKWNGENIKKGIGGSETAVIRLSEEWTKLGYKVTVFGDPEKPCLVNGVTYLPWYYFNKDDKFNVLIQWRGNFLAGRVKTRKFFVDLHDIFNPNEYTPALVKKIDKIFVKSKFHRNLAPNVPDDKFVINSNGVNI